jgi:hypothetical protein
LGASDFAVEILSFKVIWLAALFDAPKRTILPKIVEEQSPTGKLCPDRHTRVLHSVGAKGGLKASNHIQKQSSDCYTVVLHSRHAGLWRSGAVYQYRVRVPHPLVTVLGKREINRSLKTTSFSDAVRTVRKIAFEIETYFSEVHDLQSTCGATVPMTSDRDRSISIGVQVPVFGGAIVVLIVGDSRPPYS